MGAVSPPPPASPVDTLNTSASGGWGCADVRRLGSIDAASPTAHVNSSSVGGVHSLAGSLRRYWTVRPSVRPLLLSIRLHSINVPRPPICRGRR